MTRKMKKLNLLNKKFGKLRVIAQAKNLNNKTRWKCQCECSKIKIIQTTHLTRKNITSCGCWKKPPKIAIARRVWQEQYKDGISFEDFYKLSQMNCFYCGIAPSNSRKERQYNSKNYIKSKKFIYNGLDRIDNSKNHNINNCVPCCKYCNFAKRERTVGEFLSWVKKIYKKHIQ